MNHILPIWLTDGWWIGAVLLVGGVLFVAARYAIRRIVLVFKAFRDGGLG